MQRIGSRVQVMHGTAKMTGGGLKKKDLKYNKQGKIVSKKMSTRAKKEKRLQKAGYTTKKGQFGAVRTMRGGDEQPCSARCHINEKGRRFGRSRPCRDGADETTCRLYRAKMAKMAKMAMNLLGYIRHISYHMIELKSQNKNFSTITYNVTRTKLTKTYDYYTKVSTDYEYSYTKEQMHTLYVELEEECKEYKIETFSTKFDTTFDELFNNVNNVYEDLDNYLSDLSMAVTDQLW
jgi:hypothetical protein